MMKKFISIFCTLTLLASMLAVSASAAADIEFSITDAEGEAGDIVEVEVSVDKNAGVYGMGFYAIYDSRCFDLVSVTNGEVFADKEFISNVEPDDSGKFWYYAETSNNSLTTNNENTGVIMTLEFKILKAAPNGEYPITLAFGDKGDNPDGWFFGIENYMSSGEYSKRTVELVDEGIIKVGGSVAETLPETEFPFEIMPETEPSKDEDKETSVSGGNKYETEIVTEFVTDAEGEIVTDAEGEPVVTEVPIAVPNRPTTGGAEETKREPETEIVYVTDAEGNQETDAEGEPVTEIVVIDDGDDDASPLTTAILVICIVATAAAAALIVFVIISRKKGDSDKSDEQ